MKKIFKLLLVLFALSFFSQQAAMAQGADYATQSGDKLLHGIVNTATGIIELPKTMVLTSQKEGILYGTTIGFLSGLVNVVARTGFGILDVATFVIPTTEPTISPEYVWEDLGKETTYGK